MNKFVFASILLCFFSIYYVKGQSSKEVPAKIIAYIVGEWKIEKVEHGKDSSFSAYPVKISFTIDAKYNRTDEDGKTSHGTYRVNEEDEKIYLDNGLNKRPEEWNVRFKNGILSLQLEKMPQNRYFYSRIRK